MDPYPVTHNHLRHVLSHPLVRFNLQVLVEGNDRGFSIVQDPHSSRFCVGGVAQGADSVGIYEFKHSLTQYYFLFDFYSDQEGLFSIENHTLESLESLAELRKEHADEKLNVRPIMGVVKGTKNVYDLLLIQESSPDPLEGDIRQGLSDFLIAMKDVKPMTDVVKLFDSYPAYNALYLPYKEFIAGKKDYLQKFEFTPRNTNI